MEGNSTSHISFIGSSNLPTLHLSPSAAPPDRPVWPVLAPRTRNNIINLRKQEEEVECRNKSRTPFLVLGSDPEMNGTEQAMNFN